MLCLPEKEHPYLLQKNDLKVQNKDKRLVVSGRLEMTPAAAGARTDAAAGQALCRAAGARIRNLCRALVRDGGSAALGQGEFYAVDCMFSVRIVPGGRTEGGSP